MTTCSQAELDKISHRQEEAMLEGRIIRSGVKMEHLEKYFVSLNKWKFILKGSSRRILLPTLKELALSLGSSPGSLPFFLRFWITFYVTIENFMDKARNFHNHEHVSMMAQIIPLYYSNDIAGFQKAKENNLKSLRRLLYFELN